MNRKYRILIGTIEIVLGLFFVAWGSLIMLQSTINRDADMHGYALFVGIFGASLGSILAFAGVVLRQSLKLGLLSQFLFFFYIGITMYVYLKAY